MLRFPLSTQEPQRRRDQALDDQRCARHARVAPENRCQQPYSRAGRKPALAIPGLELPQSRVGPCVLWEQSAIGRPRGRCYDRPYGRKHMRRTPLGRIPKPCIAGSSSGDGARTFAGQSVAAWRCDTRCEDCGPPTGRTSDTPSSTGVIVSLARGRLLPTRQTDPLRPPSGTDQDVEWGWLSRARRWAA